MLQAGVLLGRNGVLHAGVYSCGAWGGGGGGSGMMHSGCDLSEVYIVAAPICTLCGAWVSRYGIDMVWCHYKNIV